MIIQFSLGKRKCIGEHLFIPNLFSLVQRFEILPVEGEIYDMACAGAYNFTHWAISSGQVKPMKVAVPLAVAIPFYRTLMSS